MPFRSVQLPKAIVAAVAVSSKAHSVHMLRMRACWRPEWALLERMGQAAVRRPVVPVCFLRPGSLSAMCWSLHMNVPPRQLGYRACRRSRFASAAQLALARCRVQPHQAAPSYGRSLYQGECLWCIPTYASSRRRWVRSCTPDIQRS